MASPATAASNTHPSTDMSTQASDVQRSLITNSPSGVESTTSETEHSEGRSVPKTMVIMSSSSPKVPTRLSDAHSLERWTETSPSTALSKNRVMETARSIGVPVALSSPGTR